VFDAVTSSLLIGAVVIDYRDASTATITCSIGNVTQTKLIVRQPF
jgi:hypothetical protein